MRNACPCRWFAQHLTSLTPFFKPRIVYLLGSWCPLAFYLRWQTMLTFSPAHGHDPGKQKPPPTVFWELLALRWDPCCPLSRTQTLQSPSWWLTAECSSPLISHSHPRINHTLVLLLSCSQIPAPAWATGPPQGQAPSGTFSGGAPLGQACSSVSPVRAYKLCLLLPPQKFLCASSWRKATHTNLFEESLSSLSQDLFFYWALQKVTFNIKYGSKHKISFSYVFFLQNCLLFLNFPFSSLSQDWMLVFLFVFLFLFKEHLRMIIILHSWISACLCCDLIFVDSFVV